ncbi:hypothetical protein IEU95_09305 [Hoyosella rhizosphaerae]|uniref:Uncharacterized protein n=1 Tax=Hoyosella rhizosphaerae TaxID=1755582 RepID=A0A916X9F6_9ACTN|nr:hypothetical protein [Hoyosella rhizosphaerae]MBN4927029.1 hypothetical protein [Hoyosella rhizosphaerae]GGC54625.1 hypothetical protein GCM10011410_03740 [Hoyosella rhizosphaerae]
MPNARDEEVLRSAVVRGHLQRLRHALAGVDESQRAEMLLDEAERVCEVVASSGVDIDDDRAVAAVLRQSNPDSLSAPEVSKRPKSAPIHAPAKFAIIIGVVACVFAMLVPVGGGLLGGVAVMLAVRLGLTTSSPRSLVVTAAIFGIGAIALAVWLISI